jgi:hypothetical protein
MGLFEDIADYTPVGFIYDQLDLGGTQAKRDQSSLQAQQDELRRKAKEKQMQLLNAQRGPVTTPEMEARIKALEAESTTPFALDPSVQADIRRATVGGAQALSGVQNKQLAYGARGGFTNTGSINDVYDRLGTQLADLGQKQQVMRERKRDTAAQARQGIADAEIAYENHMKSAEMAIEAGDSQAMMQALNQAAAARAAIKERTQQMVFSAIKTGVSAMAGMPNPGAAKQGIGAMQTDPNASYASQPYAGPSGNEGIVSDDQQYASFEPYYQMRNA